MSENTEQNTGNKDSLIQAMELFIKNVFAGDLNSLRSASESLEDRISKNLADTEKSVLDTIGEMGKEQKDSLNDIVSQVDKKSETVKDSLKVLEEKVKVFMDKSREELKETVANFEKDTDTLKDSIRGEMDSLIRNLRKEFSDHKDTNDIQIKGLENQLSKHQTVLTTLQQEAQRVSGFLANFSKIFGGPLSAGAVQPAPASGSFSQEDAVIAEPEAKAKTKGPKNKQADEDESENIPSSGDIVDSLDDIFKDD